MAQKKPLTPFPSEQHSSSSSDEEEEQVSGDSSEEFSGEEEATRAEEEEVDEEAESSESDQEEDPKPDSDSSSEEDEEQVTPVKPVQAKSTPKVPEQKQQQAQAPATATASAKRPREEESKAVSKNFKKRVAEEVVQKVEDSSTSKRFQRVFSEDDEVMLLNSLLDYSDKKCIDPIKDITDFHDFVNKSTHINVTTDQLSGKIRKMKAKYKKNAAKKKETFGKGQAHNKYCYDISKKIWGTGCGRSEVKTNIKGKRIPKMKNLTPGPQVVPQVQVVEEPVRENISLSELAKTRDGVGLMCLSEDTFKKGLELLDDDEARGAFEYKWVTAELEHNYKKLELSLELMKLCGKNH